VRFVKEHAIGIVIGVVLYEMYYRQQHKTKGGGGGP
jgi:hypothetical protein